ncbi:MULTISPECIES: glycosyltransferase family 2 protein [Psychrobacter]|uniref:glycosyltransferase n=1 Tax=Psychrobacter TaxID=497 RepID=UPI00146B90C4|nr:MULTISPECIES: glycosyltransferase family 2 protein [Psychrobacter]
MKIGIVIPAHNEAKTIADCLAAVQTAIAQLPQGVDAYPLVVLDNCTDDTQDIVKALGVDYLSCDYRCVGRARDFGLRHAIKNGVTWLCCTDADSTVSKDWLAEQVNQLQQPTDMICGVVSVADWSHLTSKTRDDYLAHYQDKMGHRHIHGANLSFSSKAYLTVGGFEPMPCHEDVNLVKKFENQNFDITWSNRVRVTTSSRLEARAAEGFAAFLANLEKSNS